MEKNICLLLFTAVFTFSCSNEKIVIKEGKEPTNGTSENQKNFKILALGDSYTIGHSVCDNCRFPEQLKDSLINNFESDFTFDLKVIARTGWTTTDLINAINDEDLVRDFDLVTLLIGVNNQFQSLPFSLYETEFLTLVYKSIGYAKFNKENLLVISIPDYAFTPFGNGDEKISEEIDLYNNFTKTYCNTNGITYINITDITRIGLDDPNLVASDGLHPSELAYTKFVERILPNAIDKLED